MKEKITAEKDHALLTLEAQLNTQFDSEKLTQEQEFQETITRSAETHQKELEELNSKFVV